MGKKRSWFSLVKELFIPKAKSKEEKQPKRCRWVFGRLKLKQYPAIEIAERKLCDAREEQRNHALAVAIATASAAEAAVAAALAAAEVVQLTGIPQNFGKRNRNLAALKIQTLYRAHLARKALSALKGIVRLQAVIRGQIARGRIIAKLICLRSTAKTTSQIGHLRVQSVDKGCKIDDRKQLLTPIKNLEEKTIKLQSKSQRNWDYSLFFKEGMEVLYVQNEEANTKKDRMKKYSFSHRERRNGQYLEELMSNKEDGTQHYRCEKRSDFEASVRREKEKLKSNIHSNTNKSVKYETRLKLGDVHEQDSIEEIDSPVSLPRRSFCRSKKHHPAEDESSLPNSPVFPTYMAATESAKAKARSISTPKQRLPLFDIYSVHSSTFQPKLSSWSSFNSEWNNTSGDSGTSQHISLRANGHNRS